MQELISALTAHEEECSREFEADLSAFCTRHMDAQLVQQLRQLVAEGEEDLAYRAFYALTIIYRNRKDYQQLQALFEENPHFAGHPSYHHLLILFQLEAETFFDALELLELAREDARQHRDNAGYLHLFAHLFVYTCEKSRGEMREQVRREYYDDVGARWRMPSGWTRPMPSSTAPRPVWWPSGAATPRRTALSTRPLPRRAPPGRTTPCGCWTIATARR